MKHLIFVCHGSICHSPMAEMIFRALARQAGREGEFDISSLAASREEEGNGLYPPARAKLREKGVPITPHTARQITRADYDRADLILAMDSRNLRSLRRILGGDPDGKIHLLTGYTGGGEIDDPWYTGDFETAYRAIAAGCTALLAQLTKQTDL